VDSSALSLVLASATALLALATAALAGFTWWGVHENRKLIEATKRQADLLWENAIPVLVPVELDGPLTGSGQDDMKGALKISYAAGTVAARGVRAWLGSEGLVWYGFVDVLTVSDRVNTIRVGHSRAGTEPPKDWDEWLRNNPNRTLRLVLAWSGPGEHLTVRAWWLGRGRWYEVPASQR